MTKNKQNSAVENTENAGNEKVNNNKDQQQQEQKGFSVESPIVIPSLWGIMVKVEESEVTAAKAGFVFIKEKVKGGVPRPVFESAGIYFIAAGEPLHNGKVVLREVDVFANVFKVALPSATDNYGETRKFYRLQGDAQALALYTVNFEDVATVENMTATTRRFRAANLLPGLNKSGVPNQCMELGLRKFNGMTESQGQLTYSSEFGKVMFIPSAVTTTISNSGLSAWELLCRSNPVHPLVVAVLGHPFKLSTENLKTESTFVKPTIVLNNPNEISAEAAAEWA